MQKHQVITAAIHEFLGGAYLRSQTETLVACVLGLMTGGEISLTSIGRHLPGDIDAKHKIKRVDRFCANDRIGLGPLTTQMLLALAGESRSVVISVDWTSLDDFACLTFAVSTQHGRAIPVYWEVVDPKQERTKAVEVEAVKRFHRLVPQEVNVVILADRGFDEVKFIAAVAKHFQYVIRLSKGNTISNTAPVQRFMTLASSLTVRDEVVDFGDVLFTEANKFRTRVIGKHARKSVDPWFLATNLEKPAKTIVTLYAYRFDIEHAFKDWKDVYHGWQLGSIRSKSPQRLARLLMVPAIAFLLLVLLGLHAESRKLHRGLQVNSVKNKRCLCLWRVGVLIFTTLRRLPVRTAKALLRFVDGLTLQPEVC